ncbi:MAG: class I SAM-dependent methyltransferase, partial [Candidatus Latescibacteria bacterium]|nr:class I SAM-dependent methyltransferase [Candidatus Latescibacterota bacterium]
MNEIHERNRRRWNHDSEGWKTLRDRDGLWRRCPEEPGLAFEGQALQFIRDRAGDLAGKDVCVIGSGDNYAAFALAGLGAKVTSTDISENQLEVASERAEELGLDMMFLRADAAGLRPLPDSSFDLVCSTNGFLVWISDV